MSMSYNAISVFQSSTNHRLLAFWGSGNIRVWLLSCGRPGDTSQVPRTLWVCRIYTLSVKLFVDPFPFFVMFNSLHVCFLFSDAVRQREVLLLPFLDQRSTVDLASDALLHNLSPVELSAWIYCLHTHSGQVLQQNVVSSSFYCHFNHSLFSLFFFIYWKLTVPGHSLASVTIRSSLYTSVPLTTSETAFPNSLYVSYAHHILVFEHFLSCPSTKPLFVV